MSRSRGGAYHPRVRAPQDGRKFRMDEGLDADLVEEGDVKGEEVVVDKAIVYTVDLCVVREAMVKLNPRVFDEGDSAQSWRELGSNPGSSNLLKIGNALSATLTLVGMSCVSMVRWVGRRLWCSSM